MPPSSYIVNQAHKHANKQNAYVQKHTCHAALIINRESGTHMRINTYILGRAHILTRLYLAGIIMLHDS